MATRSTPKHPYINNSNMEMMNLSLLAENGAHANNEKNIEDCATDNCPNANIRLGNKDSYEKA